MYSTQGLEEIIEEVLEKNLNDENKDDRIICIVY